MRLNPASSVSSPLALAAALACLGLCSVCLTPASAKAAKAKPAPPAAPVAPVVGPPWPPAVKEVPKPDERVVFSSVTIAEPKIAITFDDGPDSVQTPRLLEMLRERNIKATFFVLGQRVKLNPGLLKRIEAEGHEIGNHSWDHPQLSVLKEPKVYDELERTNDICADVLGHPITLMRPPYGALTLNQKWWVNRVWDYRIILWDVDSLDWKHHNPARTQSIIMEQTKPGSIILCHDIHKTTVDAMPATLDALLAKGFSFVTVSELMSLPPAPPAPPAPKAATTPKPPADPSSPAPGTTPPVRKAIPLKPGKATN